MSTLGDVIRFYAETVSVTEMFGYDERWQKEFITKFHELGQMICEEEGLPFGEDSTVGKIPHDKELGPKSEAIFQELCSWVGVYIAPS